MPKLTEEHRLARREQILDAAMNCFINNGFHQTSMNDICEESGLSVGAVYLYFESKDEIIKACWKRHLAYRQDVYQQAYKEKTVQEVAGSVGEQAFSQISMSITNRDWQLWIQLLAEATRNPAIRESLLQSWEMNDRLFAELGRRSEKEGKVHTDADLIHSIGRIHIAVHDGLVLQKILDPQKDFHGIIEMLNQFLPRLMELIGEAQEKGRDQSDGHKKAGN